MKKDPLPGRLLQHAREMRHAAAPAEATIWRRLRDRQLGGYKFRRQTPQPPFVADFYCHQAGLIVELDGDSHAEQAEYDNQRTQRLMRRGLHVIRFTNTDAMRHTDAVLEEILAECERLAPLPLPPEEGRGEGEFGHQRHRNSESPSTPSPPGEAGVRANSDTNGVAMPNHPPLPLPPGEGGVRANSSTNGIAIPNHPHPNPLPEGEGVEANSSTSGIAIQNHPHPNPLPEGEGVEANSSTNGIAIPNHPHPNPLPKGEGVERRGFTLLEMLTSIAALVILLGLMVDLARYVRNDSSVKLTKQLLHQCDVLLGQYVQRHGGPPAITPFADGPGKLDEAALQERAVQNSREFVAALRRDSGGASELFAGLPDAMSGGGSNGGGNESILSDAWGSPIVYMAGMQREIGIAPQDRPFFFSAGPDRRYLTQDDNLYSYEEKGNDAQK